MNIVNKVTLKTLKKNKTRTIVTIIGVILSAAMITAVTTFVSSMQQTMVTYEVTTAGPWQASLDLIPYGVASQVQANEKLSQTGIRHGVGYAALDESLNEYKPYVYVEEMDAQAMALYGLRLVSGRLPENTGEIVVPEHLMENGGAQVALGDTLTLAIGDRYYQDEEAVGPLGQNNGYYPEDMPEVLKVRETRTYTVVGIVKRPEFEGYSAPGYTLVTALDPAALSADDLVTMPFTAKNARDAVGLSESLLAENGLLDTAASTLHSNLLNFMGVGDNSGFNAVVYSMAVVLIVLIMVGSVSLIYNAFAISVSERSKQFGMLAGIGATSRQIRNAVLFEACFISGIGIPIGLLSGVGGIGLTLYLLRDVLNSFTNNADTRFIFSVSVPAVVAAALVSFLTVLISAWIPSRRAARVSPIEAIRMTGEIKIKRRQVKTSRLTRKLFGIEGDLAMKNFKRNRRRYRATVFSLVISIVLFLSASSFTSYMNEGVNSVYATSNYDLAMGMAPFTEKAERDAVIKAVSGLEEVDDWSVVKSASGFVSLPADIVNPDYLKEPEEEGRAPDVFLNEDGTARLSYHVYGLNDEAFRAYLDTLGLDAAAYTDPSQPRGIVLDQQVFYDRAGHLATTRLFISLPQGEIVLHDYSYDPYTGESTGLEDGEVGEAVLTLGYAADEAPLGVERFHASPDTFSIVLPEDVFDALFGNFPGGSRGEDMMAMTAADAFAAETAVNQALQSLGYTQVSLYNIQESAQTNRNLILVVNVFSYGFITLITLITVANVFNTISTNVNLRRREFAMLKSVGMTGGGFNRMINFECLFYGLKALLYGLPLSLLVTYWIHQSMDLGVSIRFHIPWLQVLLCVLGVFLIVFITMMYAMSKVRRENIVDALKNENL